MPEILAHAQAVVHRYTVRFPAHEPRSDDPHYRLFEEFRRRTRATARCAMADRYGTTAYCHGALELHHKAIEFAVLNAVDLALVQKDYPDVTDEAAFQRWCESDAHQFLWLCAEHHRGHSGIHTVSAADWEAEQYCRGLIS